jgi:WXG100 family type VII secretion target
MAGESAVNRAAMTTAYNELQSAVDDVKSLQSRLSGYQSDLQGAWVGDASSAFTSAYTAFNADFTKVIQAMQVMQEKLVATEKRYAANEAEQTASATRVSGLLNH